MRILAHLGGDHAAETTTHATLNTIMVVVLVTVGVLAFIGAVIWALKRFQIIEIAPAKEEK